MPYSYEGYGMDENIIEEFMLTRHLLDEALVGHAVFNAAFPETKSHAAGRRSIPGLFAA